MANWLRHHSWQLGLGLLVLAGAVVGILTIRNAPSEADPGMPEDQRAFWSWVGTINQGAEAAYESGIALLEAQPHLLRLYLRLADVCRDAEAADVCREALQRIQPPDSLTQLYREAALARLLGPQSTDEVVRRWQQIARDPALDPALARLIVDLGFQSEQPPWFTEIEQQWQERHAEDSAAVGVAFGMGYAAVRRFQWSIGEHLLLPLTERAPSEPDVHRELGRIYFFTRQTDKLIQILEEGIAAAVATHNLEEDLRLRGNLGWTLVLNNGDLEQAEGFLKKAVAQSRTLAMGATEGSNLNRLAVTYTNQHRYDEALAALDSVEVLYLRHRPERYPLALNQRGFVLSLLFRFSEAEAVLNKAIAEAQRLQRNSDVVLSMVTLAQLQFSMGRFAASRETSLEALALAQRDSLRGHQLGALNNLGRVERRLGNFEEATARFEQGLELAREIKNNTGFREFAEMLGRTALDLQDANAAKGYFELMLDDIQEADNPLELAEAYEGLGRTYGRFNNDTEARRYYDLALSLLAGRESPRQRPQILMAKAFSLMRTGSFEEAKAVLTDVRQHTENKTFVYTAEVYLGHGSLSQERYEEALRHFAKAETIGDELPLDLAIHWSVLSGKALSYWRLGRLPEAEAAFRKTISLIEALRENLNSSTNRAYFVQDKVQVYESFATFLEGQGRSEEAFYYTERARSRSLLDLLYTTQQGRAVDADRSTDRLIEMNRRMQAIAQFFSEEEPGIDEDAVAYSNTRMAQLRREYARADSIYGQLRGTLVSKKRIYTFDPLQSGSIRAMLDANEALVVYDLRTGPGRDAAASVVYVVLQDTVLLRPLGVNAARLAESVRFFRDQLDQVDEAAATRWEPLARRLYQDLMTPALEALPASVTHLNLISEGVLHYLPFAALQDADGRFLIERYTLSVAPSASILKLSRDRNPRRWRSMLLFANPNGRLPGSQKEVEAIASAGSAMRRHTLIGAEATQANLEQLAGEYDILHFATHGRFVARTPWRSHLELHGEDILSVEEIGRLELDAYLVTLSACESALSGGLLADVPNGDEWVGLNQAFLAAGTPTVMASLWPIDDLVSSDFMTQFYQALGPGGKANALATVQRHFIENPRTRHPFYWAPFSLIGDPL